MHHVDVSACNPVIMHLALCSATVGCMVSTQQREKVENMISVRTYYGETHIV